MHIVGKAMRKLQAVAGMRASVAVAEPIFPPAQPPRLCMSVYHSCFESAYYPIVHILHIGWAQIPYCAFPQSASPEVVLGGAANVCLLHFHDITNLQSCYMMCPAPVMSQRLALLF